MGSSRELAVLILGSFEFHMYNEIDDVNGKNSKKGCRR